jgi:hypothetical protein
LRRHHSDNSTQAEASPALGFMVEHASGAGNRAPARNRASDVLFVSDFKASVQAMVLRERNDRESGVDMATAATSVHRPSTSIVRR